ncbi:MULTISPECIES: SPOR domain-containing protein [Microbacteriaceae]|jgi:hypothetical protein|uniref:SPOR domain-containing protein n=1 Tax=Microbacteriaceae TaxID=85023 RepID=UPI003F7FBEF8
MAEAYDDDMVHKFWYNTKTGQVEQGLKSPLPDRLGPFDTREGAEHAWDKIRENSQRWADEDAAEGN